MTSIQIVVLDGHTLNPGDLSWDALRSLGTLTVHDRTPPEQTVARAKSADIVLTNKTRLAAGVLAQLPKLKFVAVLATGYDVVDVKAARARGIPVANIPSYGTQSVAQHAFALLLELTQQAGHHAATARAGRWSAGPDWCYWDGALRELAGLTLGIIGAGRIGRAAGRIGEAFGMNVLYHDISDGPANFENLLRKSDVISLHCPLTPGTRHLINAQTLALMKPGALLINTSRGPLIDDDALAAALRENRLGGAGLDVLSTEPPPADHPLLSAPRCLVTPHIAWATTAARARLMGVAVENVKAFLAGAPRNIVN
jgi:glycerate dehydrogenase